MCDKTGQTEESRKICIISTGPQYKKASVQLIWSVHSDKGPFFFKLIVSWVFFVFFLFFFFLFFTFLPEASFGLWVLSLPACVCVRVSVNHEFVRAITH